MRLQAIPWMSIIYLLIVSGGVYAQFIVPSTTTHRILACGVLALTILLVLPPLSLGIAFSQRSWGLHILKRFETVAMARTDYPIAYLAEAAALWQDAVERGRFQAGFWSIHLRSEVKYASTSDQRLRIRILLVGCPHRPAFWRAFHEFTHIVDWLRVKEEHGVDLFQLEADGQLSDELETECEKRVRDWSDPRDLIRGGVCRLEWWLLWRLTL